jgi:hypothetical protein
MPGDRTDSGRKLQVDSESSGNSDSDSARDSASEAAGAADASHGARPQTRSASKLHWHLTCQGCNKSFANKQSLRRHWNAWKTADPACRNAATKRPRTGRVDSAAARDTYDRIQRMVDDRSNRGQAASDAQSPFLQPRDEVLGPARVTAKVRLGFTL